MSTETLNNWIGWLQARIPALKESHNVYWLKQAMEGYKKDSKQIQIEPGFQKVLHEAVFENMRNKPIKNRQKELDKEVSDIELGNLSSPSLMPDLILKKYEDSHEFHFHELDRNWIIECMNEYKDACVDQRETNLHNSLKEILIGIDMDYKDNPDGWWSNTGEVEFGTEILGKIDKLLNHGK